MLFTPNISFNIVDLSQDEIQRNILERFNRQVDEIMMENDGNKINSKGDEKDEVKKEGQNESERDDSDGLFTEVVTNTGASEGQKESECDEKDELKKEITDDSEGLVTEPVTNTGASEGQKESERDEKDELKKEITDDSEGLVTEPVTNTGASDAGIKQEEDENLSSDTEVLGELLSDLSDNEVSSPLDDIQLSMKCTVQLRKLSTSGLKGKPMNPPHKRKSTGLKNAPTNPPRKRVKKEHAVPKNIKTEGSSVSSAVMKRRENRRQAIAKGNYKVEQVEVIDLASSDDESTEQVRLKN